MVADAPNWLLSTCAFIGFILCMIPLPWHLQAWNTGTCLFMIWTGLACLNQFINSVVWDSDVINRAPIWCDISTKFMIGSGAAIPAAALCINRRLYQIASVQSVTRTRAQKRRDVMVDLAIGLGIPLLVMILHVVVQGRRFVLVEEIGCYPYIWDTPLAYVLVFSWPIGIGLVSAFYSVRTIRELAIRRAEFKQFLSANKNLSSNRYFRLMALAGIDIIATVPLACLIIYFNATTAPVQAYVNWDLAHANFDTIPALPLAIWHENQMIVAAFETDRYLPIFCATVFFALFGFADEARRNYHLAYVSIAKRIGLSTGSTSAAGTWTVKNSEHVKDLGSDVSLGRPLSWISSPNSAGLVIDIVRTETC